MGSTTAIILILGTISLVVFLIFAAVFARYARLWIQSVSTGAGVGIFDLLRMTFRKVNPTVILRSKIMAVQAGITEAEGLTTKALEAHYLAGGNVPLVIRSMIAARKAKIIELDFKRATAIDLAGRNILDAVQTSVYPRVIDCPSRTVEAADARRGRQERHSAQGEGPGHGAGQPRTSSSAVRPRKRSSPASARASSAPSARPRRMPTCWRTPIRISKAVLARKLDSQTAFEIVSIDIADIDVGDNIGARLQADQAEADTRVARAAAEGRRAMAVSQEQENIAMIEENRARLVEAEAEVPKAMAEAFRTGQLGILDYYKLKNVQADTDMRESIAGVSGATGCQITDHDLLSCRW